MADRLDSVRVGDQDGGSVRTLPAGPQDLVVQENATTIPSVRGPGRPRRDGLAPGSREAQAADLMGKRRRRVAKRQRDQVRKLSKLGSELIGLPDCGAGAKGSPAAAFGTVTRALKDIHEMERAQYGLDQQQTKQVAVILLPVAASDMAAWQAESVRLLGSQPRPDAALAVRPGYRVIEADIEGAPGDD